LLSFPAVVKAVTTTWRHFESTTTTRKS